MACQTWATAFKNYDDCVTQTVTKLKEFAKEVEGGFFVFWVDSYHLKQIGCSYTGHYADVMKDPSVTRGIRDFFFQSWDPPGEEPCEASLKKLMNPWLIDYQARHLIPLFPRASERTRKEIRRSRNSRSDTIWSYIRDSCEGCQIPLVIHQNCFDSTIRKRRFASPPNAALDLFDSAFWTKLVNPNNLVDIPRLDFLSPFKKARVLYRMAGQVRQRRSLARLDFNSEQAADDPIGWLSAHLSYEVEDPGENDWVSQLFSSRHGVEFIQPTVIANSDDLLQVVMHDSRVGTKGREFVSDKLVLVTMSGYPRATFECTCQTFHAYTDENGMHDCVHCILLEHNEGYFRNQELLESPDEQGDIFPISNKSGGVVAYIQDDEVVSVSNSNNKRTLCCDRVGDGKQCRHVFRVKEYEKEHEIYSWSAGEVAEEDSGGSDPMAFIDKHPCLPLQLEQKPTPEVRHAMAELNRNGCSCFSAPPNFIHHEEPFSEEAVENAVGKRGMFPPLPTNRCSCGHFYQNRGYRVLEEKCSVYLEWPNCLQTMPLYCLECPNGEKECRVHYDGTNDGLFLLSSQTAIALKLLYDSMDAFKGSGHSPHAFCIARAEEYNGVYSCCDPAPPFMADNTWRQAFYLFIYCINANDVVFSCPCCKDQPKILISDGIRLCFKAAYYSGNDITEPDRDICIEQPNHKRHDRSFIDLRDGNDDRKKMQKLLQKFAQHVSAAAQPAEESGGGTGAAAGCMTDNEIEELIQDAALYRLDNFLCWVRVKLCAGSLQGSDKRLLAEFIGKCLATESCVLKYLPFQIMEPIVAALEVGVLHVALLDQIERSSPLLRHVLRIGGAAEAIAFAVPQPNPRRPEASPFYSLLHEMCLRSDLCRSGAGEEELNLCALPEAEVALSLPSAGIKECLTTGVCSGLPQLRNRPMFAADAKKQSNETGCRHEFLGGAEKTGGVMTVFCEHGVCYAAFIIPKAEGRDELFSFIIKYLRRPPEIVVYDFACAFQEYCLNRLPGWFKNTEFFIDRTHWPGHKTCTLAYCLSLIKKLNHLNSQAAEQCNSVLRLYERTLSRMSQVPFMLCLRLVLDNWNRKKTAGIELLGKNMRGERLMWPRLMSLQSEPASSPMEEE